MTNIEKHDLAAVDAPVTWMRFRVSLIWDFVSSLQVDVAGELRCGGSREGDDGVNWARWKHEGDDGGSRMRTRLLVGCELELNHDWVFACRYGEEASFHGCARLMTEV
ncbi:hypothetical protein VIGAN_03124500 [Vigna angularis var. angularis]|uniref:Uncharacterized protein n=1 Tax=Vigna angularis var. angularis TaxID=157739 RepID=A0A0S3RLU4_PHAAN|nr:hypothetical protein VIGAN_03124500 [Vigna angularis var. angularis]